MSDQRAQAMAARLTRAAAQAELTPTDTARLKAAFEYGHDQRMRLLDDPHHAHALHGARTALILLEDAGFTDPDGLALAVLFESRFLELVLDADSIRRLAGDRAATFAASLPIGDEQDVALEMLLTAEPAASAVALAERLDHARHLHLEPRVGWPNFHANFEAVYLPVSDRTHPRLARRCRWWSAMFARRYLRSRGVAPDPAS
jgi:hypothetical protein